MYFPFFIAKSYYQTKKKKHLIHYLSLIASLSIGLSTMILLLVLSVFNGMEDLMYTLFRSFAPPIKVELKEGKYFTADDQPIEGIHTVEGVAAVTRVLEDNVLVRHKNLQIVATIKGVASNSPIHNPLIPYIQKGYPQLQKNGKSYAILGQGIQKALALYSNDLATIELCYPKTTHTNMNLFSQLYNKKHIAVGGIFAIEKKIDAKYILAPLPFVSHLMGATDKITSLEIQVDKNSSELVVQKALQQQLPSYLQVRNSREQNEDLIRTIAIERFLVLLIFSTIFLIAALNIFFMLAMFVLEKRKDIIILRTMGVTHQGIHHIFLIKGLLVALKGALGGLIAAYLLGLLQQNFGIVSLGITQGVITAYPIKMVWSDFVYTIISTLLFTLLAAYFPAKYAETFTKPT